MQIQVLGPVRVVRNGAAVQVGGPRQQTVLSVLVSLSNETSSVDRLIDEIWGEEPPAAAKNSLQSMVSNLRKALHGEEISIDREGSGYVLRVPDSGIDARIFATLVGQAREHLGSAPAVAAETLREALALWRGRPYGGLADDVPVLQAEAVRLEELRLRAVEYRVEADLAIGRHGELVGELEGLIESHPMVEGFYRLLMLALYRSDRQAEALRVYGRLRRTLADTLGIDPSHSLQQLEQQVLEQDPSLLSPSTDGPGRVERPNPYKGLVAFCEGDAADFFGRDELVAEVLARIGETGSGGFVALVGPSGAGKSSIVNAGLIPRLRLGAAPGSDRWVICRMYPGSHPFEELEAALLRAAPEAPAALLDVLTDGESGLRRAARIVVPDDESQLLLVIDQFEELFLLTPPEDRLRFVRLLTEGLADERPFVVVVVTLRSDFLGEPLLDTRMADLFRAGTALVPPMGARELEQAIAGPAGRVGVEVEPSLVVAAISDVEGNPGALPMLQHALTETFELRESDRLTRDDYEAVGGVTGAVANTAVAATGSLAKERRNAARQILLRLVVPGEGAADTRRRVAVSELYETGLTQEDVDGVLDALGQARLLTFDTDPATQTPTVELAHEALLAGWPQLREWVDEARSDVVTERRLGVFAEEWEAQERAEGYLLSGPRLAEFAE